jgi:hypothetical protein
MVDGSDSNDAGESDSSALAPSLIVPLHHALIPNENEEGEDDEEAVVSSSSSNNFISLIHHRIDPLTSKSTLRNLAPTANVFPSIALVAAHSFPHPNPPKVDRGWQDDWYSDIIERSPYNDCVGPMRITAVPTPAEIAQRRILKVKKRIGVPDAGIMEDDDPCATRNKSGGVLKISSPIKKSAGGGSNSNSGTKRSSSSANFEQQQQQQEQQSYYNTGFQSTSEPNTPQKNQKRKKKKKDMMIKSRKALPLTIADAKEFENRKKRFEDEEKKSSESRGHNGEEEAAERDNDSIMDVLQLWRTELSEVELAMGPVTDGTDSEDDEDGDGDDDNNSITSSTTGYSSKDSEEEYRKNQFPLTALRGEKAASAGIPMQRRPEAVALEQYELPRYTHAEEQHSKQLQQQSTSRSSPMQSQEVSSHRDSASSFIEDSDDASASSGTIMSPTYMSHKPKDIASSRNWMKGQENTSREDEFTNIARCV